MAEKPEKMKLLIASRNQDKIDEIKSVMNELQIEFVTAAEYDLPEIIEDQDSIIANAGKKALESARISGLLCLADDTGFFVKSLNDQPGIYAARYAGNNCTYRDNRLKLLKELTGKSDRSAEFRTAVALATPQSVIKTTVGIVKGSITLTEIGLNGFGYDSIFRADETGLTFGEMTAEDKNKISHRAKALQNLLPWLKQYLKEISNG